jgi:hypothetical protein
MHSTSSPLQGPGAEHCRGHHSACMTYATAVAGGAIPQARIERTGAGSSSSGGATPDRRVFHLGGAAGVALQQAQQEAGGRQGDGVCVTQ